MRWLIGQAILRSFWMKDVTKFTDPSLKAITAHRHRDRQVEQRRKTAEIKI